MKKDEIQKIKNLDRSLVWHPFTQMQDYMSEDPLIIERGEGCFLFDVEGNRYIDGVSSLWVNVHGHRKKQIDEAIQNQLGNIAHSTLLGAGNIPSVKLAEALLQVAPDNLAKVFYSDSGATSVEIALKMAFQYWQQKGGAAKNKTQFVTLQNAYHGDTIGSVSVGKVELFHKIFKPLLFDSLAISNFDLEEAREIFEKNSGTIAACIVEPLIQGAAGMRTQPDGFLKGLRELCDKHGAFLIVDEVATGFGRTGKMFAVEHEGVKPDFLCLAKGITGGYLPLAATLTTEEVFAGFQGAYRDFRTFFHGHSYTGNPLACAAAVANLELFHRERILEQLPEKIEFLAEELIRFSSHPHVLEVRGKGMMVGIELIQDKAQQIPYPVENRVGNQVCLAARKRGILVRPLGDVLVVMPPLAMDLETMHELLNGLYGSLEEVTGLGFPSL